MVQKLHGVGLICGPPKSVESDPLPVSAAADAHAVLALGFESPMPKRIDRLTRMLTQVASALINSLMQTHVVAASARGGRLLSIVPHL